MQGRHPGDAPLGTLIPCGRVRTLRTGQGDRVANMLAFAAATLELLIEALEAAPPTS